MLSSNFTAVDFIYRGLWQNTVWRLRTGPSAFYLFRIFSYKAILIIACVSNFLSTFFHRRSLHNVNKFTNNANKFSRESIGSWNANFSITANNESIYFRIQLYTYIDVFFLIDVIFFRMIYFILFYFKTLSYFWHLYNGSKLV